MVLANDVHVRISISAGTLNQQCSDWCGNRWKTTSNPGGEWQTAVSEDAVVLHYAYSYLSDVRDKAGKSCPGAEYLEAARRGDRAKVRRSRICRCCSHVPLLRDSAPRHIVTSICLL